ncbi:hypothetical protein ON010_g2345 [Phytophthora cinnamomi]|nr:hypothetical protein ON010_g2345 [Phytophthora cinnamomi]
MISSAFAHLGAEVDEANKQRHAADDDARDGGAAQRRRLGRRLGVHLVRRVPVRGQARARRAALEVLLPHGVRDDAAAGQALALLGQVLPRVRLGLGVRELAGEAAAEHHGRAVRVAVAAVLDHLGALDALGVARVADVLLAHGPKALAEAAVLGGGRAGLARARRLRRGRGRVAAAVALHLRVDAGQRRRLRRVARVDGGAVVALRGRDARVGARHAAAVRVVVAPVVRRDLDHVARRLVKVVLGLRGLRQQQQRQRAPPESESCCGHCVCGAG